MYAIIETGGKQYRIAKGDLIDVELIEPSSEGKVRFTEVLLVSSSHGVKIGAPHVPSAVVHGEFVRETAGPKVVAYKYKKRKGYRRKVGHRQHYSTVRITEIVA